MLLYSKQPATAHNFNAKLGLKRYAPSPDILAKMCKDLSCQTKPAYFETFWPIPQDPFHIFQKAIIALKLVLSTNPILQTIRSSDLVP